MCERKGSFAPTESEVCVEIGIGPQGSVFKTVSDGRPGGPSVSSFKFAPLSWISGYSDVHLCGSLTLRAKRTESGPAGQSLLPVPSGAAGP